MGVEEVWWYRQTEATKCGGKAAGSLSTGIVPRRPANPTRGEPEEGRAVSGLWDRCWETRRIRWDPETCARNSSG